MSGQVGREATAATLPLAMDVAGWGLFAGTYIQTLFVHCYLSKQCTAAVSVMYPSLLAAASLASIFLHAQTHSAYDVDTRECRYPKHMHITQPHLLSPRER